MTKNFFLVLAFAVVASLNFSLAQDVKEKVEKEQVEEAEEDLNAVFVPRPAIEEKKDKFNISFYEPMYILLGHPTSRIQFSFKYQFIREFPVYLGYVQDIFWLFQESSHPFRDANYNPRLFYRYSFDKDDDEKYLDFIAFEHKSNGRGNPESRSFDGSGAKISYRFEYANWSLKLKGKGLYRYDLDETNHDLEKFVGPFEVGFALSQYSFDWLDRGELTYRVYTGGEWGENFGRTSHEVGLSFRLFGRFLTPSIYVQYFNGYSESLLNYNKREENFRFGFLL